VTVLYETVRGMGPDVRATDGLEPGAVVCFSPSYCSTRVQRLFRVQLADGTVGTETRWFHLVPAAEVFYTVSE